MSSTVVGRSKTVEMGEKLKLSPFLVIFISENCHFRAVKVSHLVAADYVYRGRVNEVQL
jgi:hypothetical protein